MTAEEQREKAKWRKDIYNLAKKYIKVFKAGNKVDREKEAC